MGQAGGPTLRDFVRASAACGATVCTDEAATEAGLGDLLDGGRHETVQRSVAEHARDMAPTNSVESFRSLRQRAHQGVHRKISPQHLHRHVADFAARHGVRVRNTSAQLGYAAAGMCGKRLTYWRLIADNGLASGGGPERRDVAGVLGGQTISGIAVGSQELQASAIEIECKIR